MAGDATEEPGQVAVTVTSIAGNVLLGPGTLVPAHKGLEGLAEALRVASPDVAASKDVTFLHEGKRLEADASLGELCPAAQEGAHCLQLVAVFGRRHVTWRPEKAATERAVPPAASFAPASGPWAPIVHELLTTQSLAGVDGDQLRELCAAARSSFLEQPSLLELEAPMHVLGGVMGHLRDLLAFLAATGPPGQQRYLFLGDYVDRGPSSLEVMTLLFAYKVQYPESFFLLRGKHECSSISRIYGFFQQCKRLYHVRAFDCMPVAAVVGNAIFCCLGGLSPELRTLDQIRRLERPIVVPDFGLLCDLLWAEPDADVSSWAEVDAGVSFKFGWAAVQSFLEWSRFDLVCRGSMVLEEGFEFFAGGKLVSLWTAADYCLADGNGAAMLSVAENLECSLRLLKSQTAAEDDAHPPLALYEQQ